MVRRTRAGPGSCLGTHPRAAALCWPACAELAFLSESAHVRGLCEPVPIPSSNNGREDFRWHGSSAHQALLAQRGSAASWTDLRAAHGRRYCPCYVGARTYANHSYKTGLFTLFPTSFKNRCHFLSATGDAQPFIKGCQCMV